MNAPRSRSLFGYRLEELIRQDGFARTWRVSKEKPDSLHEARYFALKEYFPKSEVTQDPSGKVVIKEGHHSYFLSGARHFLEEALIIQTLRHPNILVGYGVLAGNGTLYTLMEYVDGQTLAQQVRVDGPMREEVVQAWTKPLLDALHHVHNYDPALHTRMMEAYNGLKPYIVVEENLRDVRLSDGFGQSILHLDICPTNILLRRTGEPVLIDFGLARQKIMFTPDRREVLVEAHSRTYAAPEQFVSEDQEQLKPRTDLFGLGGCVYYALTGQDPLPAHIRLFERLKTGDPQPKLAGKSGGSRLRRMADKALRLNSARRPQSAAGWLRALGEGQYVDPDQAPGGKTGLVLLGLGVAALLAGAGLLFMNQHGAQEKAPVVMRQTETDYHPPPGAGPAAVPGLVSGQVVAQQGVVLTLKSGGGERALRLYGVRVFPDLGRADLRRRLDTDLQAKFGKMLRGPPGEVRCEPVGSQYRCWLGRIDLARWAASQGLLQADGADDYSELSREASVNQLGFWHPSYD